MQEESGQNNYSAIQNSLKCDLIKDRGKQKRLNLKELMVGADLKFRR